MSTVGEMSRSSYMAFKLGQQNSVFASLNTQGLFGDGQNNSLFSGSSIFVNRSDLNLLKSAISKQLAEKKDTFTELDSYTDTANKFYTGFFTNTKDLQSSSKTLANTDFSSGKTEDIVKSVKQFADDYNKTNSFLKDNAKLSSRISNLAMSFDSAKYSRNSLESIGVNVDSSGKLSVDEAKLSSALSENSKEVGNILGKKGLANQTYNKVAAAMDNSADLVPFPSIANKAPNGLMPGLLLDFFV